MRVSLKARADYTAESEVLRLHDPIAESEQVIRPLINRGGTARSTSSGHP